MTTDLEVVVIGALSDVGTYDFRDEVLRIKGTMFYGDSIRVESPKVPVLLALEFARTRVVPKWLSDRPNVYDDDMAEAMATEIERRLGERGPTDPLESGNFTYILDLLRKDKGIGLKTLMEMPEVISEMVRQGKGRTDLPPFAFQDMTPDAIRSQVRRKQPDDAPAFQRAANDLARLLESGVAVLDTQPAYVQAVLGSEFDDMRTHLDNLPLRIEEILLDTSRSAHPLFSSEARVHVRDLAEKGRLSGADFRNANRVEIANQLVISVPNFPLASVDELLDVRERVAPHLARFRRAIIDFEEKLEVDITAANFDAEVRELAATEVDPALEELNQSLLDNGAAQTLSRGVPFAAGGMLLLGASVVTGAPDLAGLIAVATGLTTATAKEVQRRFGSEDKRKQHQLFLLFDAGRALEA